MSSATTVAAGFLVCLLIDRGAVQQTLRLVSWSCGAQGKVCSALASCLWYFIMPLGNEVEQFAGSLEERKSFWI